VRQITRFIHLFLLNRTISGSNCSIDQLSWFKLPFSRAQISTRLEHAHPKGEEGLGPADRGIRTKEYCWRAKQEPRGQGGGRQQDQEPCPKKPHAFYN
jgi:hypothetical protein